MTHLTTTKARKNFVVKKIRKANARETRKIYLATEKAIKYKKKRKYKKTKRYI